MYAIYPFRALSFPEDYMKEEYMEEFLSSKSSSRMLKERKD
jgi:hypothetical protein